MKPVSGRGSGLMLALKKLAPRKHFDTSSMKDFDDYEAELIGVGSSAVVLVVNRSFAIKNFASGLKRTQDLNRELKIFEKLSLCEWSPYVVQFIAQWGRGIIMERLEMTLRQRLHLPNISTSLEDRWILETCKGIAFLHSKEIIHGDIGCQNILIDSDGHAKICDFAGSKIGDEDSWVRYQVRNQHPKYNRQQPTTKTELFALGSVIFEIATSRQPYEELLDSIVQNKFEKGEFPLEEVSRPEIRRVVKGCWQDSYVHVEDLCADLESR
jgi:serine/threonine protein kinase